MGVDCSLVFGYEDGVKWIHLDRSYVFSRIEMNKWMHREKLSEQIRKVLDFKDNSQYSSYWMGYAKGCIENLYLDEDVKFLAIVDEQHSFYEYIHEAIEKNSLKYESKKLIPMIDAKDFLK
jgi:hypothetical protein